MPSLTNNLLVGGLGVEYLVNDPTQDPILLHVVLGLRERLQIKTTLDDVKQQIRYVFTAVPFDLLR